MEMEHTADSVRPKHGLAPLRRGQLYCNPNDDKCDPAAMSPCTELLYAPLFGMVISLEVHATHSLVFIGGKPTE